MTSRRSEEPEVAREHVLSVFDVGCIVVGGIVGVGIFFTPQSVARAVGSAEQSAVLAWSIGGAIAMLGALVFAELASRVPGHGGTFAYLHRAFPPLLAFLYGWANWLVIQSGALAVVGLVMADYAEELLFGTRAAGDGTKVLASCAAILVLTLVNAAGLSVGKRVQNALTVVKVVAVLALCALSFAASGAAPASPAAPPRADHGVLAGLAAAMLPVMFAFGGWQQGGYVAGAARRRDVAIGVVAGVAVVVAAYVTVNLAFLELLGFEGARAADAIGAEAARAALAPFGHGELGARVVAGLVVVSALGIMNTICLAPPDVLHAMARAGLFPAAAGRMHATRGAPVLATLVQGAWAIALCGVGHAVLGLDIGFLVDGVVCVDWVFFALCGAALLRLRARGASDDDGVTAFRAPAGGAVATVFTVVAFAIAGGAVWTNARASFAGLGVCALGVLVFVGVRRRARS